MGIVHFFGHEGHSHGVVENTVPWWQDQSTVSSALIIGLVVVLFFMHYIFKATFALKITVVMAYLLVIGVACYSVAPILSIVSLTIGMALALTMTMLTLAHKNSPRK